MYILEKNALRHKTIFELEEYKGLGIISEHILFEKVIDDYIKKARLDNNIAINRDNVVLTKFNEHIKWDKDENVLFTLPNIVTEEGANIIYEIEGIQFTTLLNLYNYYGGTDTPYPFKDKVNQDNAETLANKYKPFATNKRFFRVVPDGNSSVAELKYFIKHPERFATSTEMKGSENRRDKNSIEFLKLAVINVMHLLMKEETKAYYLMNKYKPYLSIYSYDSVELKFQKVKLAVLLLLEYTDYELRKIDKDTVNILARAFVEQTKIGNFSYHTDTGKEKTLSLLESYGLDYKELLRDKDIQKIVYRKTTDTTLMKFLDIKITV